MSGYLAISAASTRLPTSFCGPKKLYVWMKCTFPAQDPASSGKRPPDIPQCDTTGTGHADRCSDLTTCAPGAALPTRITASAPAVKPPRLDSPQPLLTSISPGVFAPKLAIACFINARSTSTSTAETRKT